MKRRAQKFATAPLDVINQAKPNILVGVSGQTGLFSEEIICAIASHTEQFVVLPLSNPASRIEAVSQDIIHWSDGRPRLATVSPFDPVAYNCKTHQVAHCNNSYIFPGMGLGGLAAGARRVTDGMFMAAAEARARISPPKPDCTTSLLPDLKDIRPVSKPNAFPLGRQAQSEGAASKSTENDLKVAIDAKFWTPHYKNICLKQTRTTVTWGFSLRGKCCSSKT